MNNLLDVFKALGDEARLRILRAVEIAELSVAEIVTALKMPQSSVSRHRRRTPRRQRSSKKQG